MSRHTTLLSFYLNGEYVEIGSNSGFDPETTILEYVRKRGLTGTKLVCGEGGCGACTVVVSRKVLINEFHSTQNFSPSKEKKTKILHRPINACLASLGDVHGAHVTTIEGLAKNFGNNQESGRKCDTDPNKNCKLYSSKAECNSLKKSSYIENTCLHPIQKALVDSHGSQCGYCTPGFIMAVFARYALNAQQMKPMQPHDIEDCLDGNLCRCTGYRPIYEGFKTKLCKISRKGLFSGKNGGVQVDGTVLSDNLSGPEDVIIPHIDVMEKYLKVETTSLQLIGKHLGEDCVFFRPKSIDEVLNLLKQSKNFRLQVGATERRIEMVRVGNHKYPIDIISLSGVEIMADLIQFETSLEGFNVNKEIFRIGASVPLVDMEQIFKKKLEELRAKTTTLTNQEYFQAQVLDSYIDMLKWFAGNQIRNVASLGGNIVTGSPIADLNPLHVAAGVVLTTAVLEKGILTNSIGWQHHQMEKCSEFWTGYRKTKLDPKEIITEIEIPMDSKSRISNVDETTVQTTVSFFRSYKQARRKEDDISIVNSAFRVEFDMKSWKKESESLPVVLSCTFVYGGMGPTTIRCEKLETFWKEACCEMKLDKLIENSNAIIEEEMKLPIQVPGGMSEFRLTLCKSFFLKFIRHCARGLGILRDQTNASIIATTSVDPPTISNESSLTPISVLLDPNIDSIDAESYPLHGLQHWHRDPASVTYMLGKSNPHLSAALQVTGRAQYVTDRPETSTSALDGGMSGFGSTSNNYTGEMHLDYVLSEKPHAIIESIDYSQLETIPGYIGKIDYDDIIRGQNNIKIGPIVHDDMIFPVDGLVNCLGQVICCVLATDRMLARDLCRMVKINWKEELPFVISIEEAIAKRSFMPMLFSKPGNMEACIYSRKGNVDQIIRDGIIKGQNDLSSEMNLSEINSRGEVVSSSPSKQKYDFFPSPRKPKEDFTLDRFFSQDLDKEFKDKKHEIYQYYYCSKDSSQSMISVKDLEKPISSRIHVCESEILMQGQEHFYFETHAAQVEFRDNDIFVTTSNQGLSETQLFIAEATGYPLHKIHVKATRVGGGFGGKETRAGLFAVYPVLAGLKYKRNCRFFMERDIDFKVSGMRHAFVGRYKLAIEEKSRKIIAADLVLYANAGCSYDLSVPVLNRAMLHSENCMGIQNFRVRGMLCKTNIPSNTAFRGFGGPQGLFVAEKMAETAADILNSVTTGRIVRTENDNLLLSREDILEANFYAPTPELGVNTAFYNHPLNGCPIRSMWKEIKMKCDYDTRKQAIMEFNKTSTYRKRGIALLPTKYGISFTAKHLNQAGAQVSLFKDGTILINHSGVEMGQGLHSKIASIVASFFDIPIDCVHVAETSTDTIANTPPTAASSGTDLNGFAVQEACMQILIDNGLGQFIKDSGKGEFISVEELNCMQERKTKIKWDIDNPERTNVGADKPESKPWERFGLRPVKFVKWKKEEKWKNDQKDDAKDSVSSTTKDDVDAKDSDDVRKEFFANIVTRAWFNRINLCGYGFYKTPVNGVDWSKTELNAFTGSPFYYYAWGVACTEVEVDCLTGDHLVLRSDILHDVGKSINPSIDVGQIEGAFTQGLGLFTTEEVVYLQTSQNENGIRQAKYFSVGPGNYKIPSLRSIPRDFRVHLLSDSPGPSSIMGSKAVGEPPLFLGCSVYFAIIDAIKAYNRANNKGLDTPLPRLDSPLTSEKIRMACRDTCNHIECRKPDIESSNQEVKWWHARV